MNYVINHSEVEKGWLIKRRYFCVSIHCTFDWWGLQSIRDQRLSRCVLLDRMPTDKWPTEDIGMHALTVEHFLNGRIDRFHCRTKSGAETHEQELITALKFFGNKLKSHHQSVEH